MPETATGTALGDWSVPQCPFTIQYVPAVLDEIRLAISEAFFSVPRGGAEIGGVLLGHFENRRLLISGYAALDCEHATGPSFVLSANDHSRLAELLAAHRGNDSAAHPVGWYHSHTRTEINLSDEDLEIHRRYFPEPWQVALVLKPHTFQPTRGGFFFREQDGSIHWSASYKEFTLQVPRLEGSTARTPFALPPSEPETEDQTEPEPEVAPMRLRDPVQVARILDMALVPQAPAEPEPPPRAAAVPFLPVADETVLTEVAPPAFTQVAPERSWRWLGMVLSVVAGFSIGVGAYETRQYWIPAAWTHSPAPSSPKLPYIGLSTLDAQGQLQIRWDRDSPAVRSARDAIIVIDDGPMPQPVQLNQAQLQAGAFTYARQGARVDVTVTLNEPDGQTVKETTTFLGQPPRPPAPVEDPAVKQRDALAKELQTQKNRAKKLEKSNADMRDQLQRQLRKRMENQQPDAGKF